MSVEAKIGSLRERKKAQTRDKLVSVAYRLFAQQGFEATTLEQIADEAEVSTRTLLRYFDSKVQLALAWYQTRLTQFQDVISEPERQRDTVSCWRAHVEDTSRAISDAREYALSLKFVHKVPALVAGMIKINWMFEGTIAAGLARDAGIEPKDDLYGRLLAAMLVAGNAAATRHWIVGGCREDLTKTSLAVVDFAIHHFPIRAPHGGGPLGSR